MFISDMSSEAPNDLYPHSEFPNFYDFKFKIMNIVESEVTHILEIWREISLMQ